MKHQVYIGIAIRIIILFGIGMLWTFINPELREFFGDVPCVTKWCGDIDKQYTWSARHYWYFWMMFFLFILSIINAIIGIVKVINKHYPNL